MPILAGLAIVMLAACAAGSPPAPAAPAAACPVPAARATPAVRDVLAVIDTRLRDLDAHARASEVVQHAPADAVDVLERVVASASADELAAYRPDSLLSLVDSKTPRRARRSAECIARIYDAAAGAERASHGDTHTLRFVASLATLLHYISTLPPPCWEVPCEGADEVCVHATCCPVPGGPTCDAAAPYCARRRDLPTRDCPVSSISGNDATCTCRSP